MASPMDPALSLVPRRCGGLISKIHDGDCVLVLGPRVGMPPAIDGSGTTPIDDYLAKKLLEELGVEGTMGLRDVIGLYEQRPGGVATLRGLMQQLAQELDGHTTDLHRDLASLPLRLVLHATPDTMMHNAFQAVGKSGVVPACYDYCGGRSSDVPLALPTPTRPIVYSLFGRHDRPESMVLTDANLLDYLVRITKESPPLPDPVRATLRSPATQFLFVGFGFTNWWLRLLLKVLDVTGVENRGLSLALEDSSSFQNASKENKGFFESAGIFIQAGDWHALASALAVQSREEEKRRSAPVTVMAPGALGVMTALGAVAGTTGSVSTRRPLVFLSYASEDVDTVNEIRNGLQSRGVTVWQDKQNLRAGQNWEAQIAEVIRRVDFFVFVQTEAMDRRDERRARGVYYRELDLALDLTKDLRPGTVFVIPTTVGTCRPLPQISSLHQVQLDAEGGIDALASAILESFAPAAGTLQAAG